MNLNKNPYSSLKILHHTDKLQQMRNGDQPTPSHVHLIISDFCNHNCSFCAYRMDGYTSNQLFKILNNDGTVNNNPKRMIPTEKCYEILEDCKVLGVKAIQFPGGGEPTVHKDHISVFQKCLDLGLDLALVTNGTVVRPELPFILSKSKWVRISVDAGLAKTYAKVREVPESYFDRVWKNIAAIAEERNKHPESELVIGVGFVVTKDNYKEVVDAARLAKNAGADNIRISAMFGPDDFEYHKPIFEEANQLAKKAMEESTDKFTVLNRYGDRIEDLKQQSTDYSYCGYMHLTTVIGADLNVYRCCNTSYSSLGLLGSIKNQRFKDFWLSDEKKNKMNNFSAQSCERCMFNSQNRLINYALEKNPLHVNFI